MLPTLSMIAHLVYVTRMVKRESLYLSLPIH